MKNLVIDLDGTLTIDEDHLPYGEKRPNQKIVDQVRAYKTAGFTIIIMTSRNMRTHNNSIGKINATTLPTTIEWLKKHDIPFDEIHVGKPWCGYDGFYVDDRAIRPSEFSSFSYEELIDLLNEGKTRTK